MNACKIYLGLKHCVDLKRPRSRKLRPGDFAHTNHLRLVFKCDDSICVFLSSDETYALDSARRVVEHEFYERQSFGSALGVVGIVFLVFVGFFLDLRNFSAQNDIVASAFDVDYVIWHLRYAVDFASCIHFFSDSRAYEAQRRVGVQSGVDMEIQIVFFFVRKQAFFDDDIDILIERAIKILVEPIKQVACSQKFVSGCIENEFYVDIIVADFDFERIIVDAPENHLIVAIEKFKNFVFYHVVVGIRSYVLHAHVNARKHLANYIENLFLAFFVERTHLECGNDKFDDQLSFVLIVGRTVEFEHRELAFALYRKLLKKLR